MHCKRIDIGHHGTIIPGYVLSKYVLHGNSSLLFIIDIISYLLAGIQFNSRIPSILIITIDRYFHDFLQKPIQFSTIFS